MTVISFDHVTKWYLRYHHVLTGIKASLLHLPETLRAFRRERFKALDDVSFQIKQGEAVGIIGANGSGKSTSLALMAGVLKPQLGNVEVRGRICPLLELGAGFHPELTGYENIILNGVLLGLRRNEVLTRMKDIIAFSELEEFLDQPIRTYSTGMVTRLGFAVVAHLDPDVLLVDEVLAVGDLHFQDKCYKKILEFKRQEKTIVLVSHAIEEVRRLCDRVIWLRGGKVAEDGETDQVLARYQEFQMQSVG